MNNRMAMNSFLRLLAVLALPVGESIGSGNSVSWLGGIAASVRVTPMERWSNGSNVGADAYFVSGGRKYHLWSNTCNHGVVVSNVQKD